MPSLGTVDSTVTAAPNCSWLRCFDACLHCVMELHRLNWMPALVLRKGDFILQPPSQSHWTNKEPGRCIFDTHWESKTYLIWRWLLGVIARPHCHRAILQASCRYVSWFVGFLCAVLISIFEAKRCGGESLRPGKFAELMTWWCPQPRRDLTYLLTCWGTSPIQKHTTVKKAGLSASWFIVMMTLFDTGATSKRHTANGAWYYARNIWRTGSMRIQTMATLMEWRG